MRQFKVTERYDNQRIDAFLFDMLKGVPASVIYKAFRKRSIKVNGLRVKESYRLSKEEQVEVYIPEECLTAANLDESASKLIQIIYEDNYIIVVSKPQGMPVHQDKNNDALVLDTLLKSFIEKRDSIQYEEGFPALCHRIDRNTGGLVVFAKDSQTLNILLDKFRNHEIRKTYVCLVNGVPKKPSQELIGFLKKDSVKSYVEVFDHHVKNSDKIITRYRILKVLGEFSLLEVELVTGKTHQIRAHLAHIGHSLVGDGKYGKNSINKALGIKWQALWAVNITFNLTTPSEHIAYLSGKSISLPHINWEGNLDTLINHN